MRDLRSIRLEDPGDRPDDAAKRLVARALLVRQAAAAEHSARHRDLPLQLATKTRLADPGRAEDGCKMRSLLVDGAQPQRPEQVEFVAAPDHRRVPQPPLTGRRPRRSRHPDAQRFRLPLRLDRPHELVLDCVAARQIRRLADRDPPHGRRGL